jgi:hypothetical protein
VRFRPIFAWYDLWVGVFVDRAKRRVYVFPVPCIGVVVSWGQTERANEGECASSIPDR